MAIRSDEMVIQFDERLPDFFFGYADDLPHQDHERKKDFRNQASKLLGQENILSSHDGEDKQETAGDHEEDQNTQGEAEDQGEGGMNVSQPHDGDVPEQKDENEENHTGKDEQLYEDSLLRPILQYHPPTRILMSKFGVRGNRMENTFIFNIPLTNFQFLLSNDQFYFILNLKACHHSKFSKEIFLKPFPQKA